MILTARVTSIVALAAAAVAVIAVLTAAAVGLRLRRLRRAYREVADTVEHGDLLGEVSRQATAVARMQAAVTGLGERVELTRVELADAIRHVAVVRYDAFDEMGGRLSFSAAMLDDGGDGLVISSIHGRSETRSYAKGVKSGRSEATLSPEEQQAVGYALRAAPALPRRDRGRRSAQEAVHPDAVHPDDLNPDARSADERYPDDAPGAVIVP